MEVLQRTANRGSISTGSYEIDNSLKFEIDNSECLTKTFGSSGNRKAWTWSSWVKRTELNSSTTYQLLFSAGTGNPPRDVFFFDDDTDDTLCFFSNGGLLSSATLGFRTNAVFRDTSAWYHIVLVLDTANSTAADRLKLYVNGVSQTFSTYNAPTQNADSLINSNTDHAIGRDSSFAALGFNAQYFSGYMAETHFVDGSQLAPTDFGEYDEDSGIWKPKAYTGSYGTNGFYLDFEDNTSAGKDTSGNNNNFSDTNLNAADHATDTPTNNFATFNALLPKADLREGATRFFNHDAGEDTNLSTIAVTSGKWYAEFSSPSNISGGNGRVGVSANVSGQISEDVYLGSDAWNVAVTSSTGSVGTNNSFSSYLGSGFSANDLISVALDMDNKKVYFALNGTWGNSGNPATGTNGVSLPSAYEDYEWFIGVTLVLNTNTFNANYGGFTTISISSAASDENGYGTFEYAPPSGYYALCTKNLAEYG